MDKKYSYNYRRLEDELYDKLYFVEGNYSTTALKVAESLISLSRGNIVNEEDVYFLITKQVETLSLEEADEIIQNSSIDNFVYSDNAIWLAVINALEVEVEDILEEIGLTIEY